MTDHDTVAVLAHHVRRLDHEACTALVADLWAARGHETRREGREVVATRYGTTERIRVGAGHGTADPPDVVVTPDGGRAVHATDAGVQIVDGDDLARMLRYAVDRPTAAALCERHLGASPESLRPSVVERLQAGIAALRTAAGAVEPGGSSVAPASVVGVVLVLLVVGAVAGVALTGTAGPSSADAGDGGVEALAVPDSTPVGDRVVEASTPATTAPGSAESVPNASIVPGLSEGGIDDLSALAAAHADALLGGSYTLWMDTYRPPPDDRDGEPRQFDTDVAVSGDRFLVQENVGDDESRERLRTIYHDGEGWYLANETGGGRTYERVALEGPTPPPSPDPDAIALGLVVDYLATPTTAVEGYVGGGGGGDGGGDGGDGEPARFRVVGRGTPPTMAGDGVRNYAAVALVDRDGLVRDLTVTYTVVVGDETYRVRKEWTYGYLGETTVDPPAWYVERFAGDTDTA